MEQSARTTNKPKISRLAVLSFILSLAPIIGVIGAILEIFTSNSILYVVVFTAILGIILGIISLGLFAWGKRKRPGGGFAIAAVTGGILYLLFFVIFIPSHIRIRQRAREGEVKRVVHILETCIEEYNTQHSGERPRSVKIFDQFLPESVKVKKNPFNSMQTYSVSGGGLIDGKPSRYGIIGYIAPQNTGEPYKLTFYVKGLGNTDTLIEFVEPTFNLKGIQ